MKLDRVVGPVRDRAVNHQLLGELIAGTLSIDKVRNFVGQFYYRIKDVPNRRIAIAQLIREFTDEQIKAKKLGYKLCWKRWKNMSQTSVACHRGRSDSSQA